LDAGESANLRCAGSGSISGIDGINIQCDVNRLATECLEVAPEERDATVMKFLGGDHFYFVLFGEVEIVFVVDLAAQAYLQECALQDEIFLDRAAKRRAVGIAAAEIFVPQIVVGVELNDCDWAVKFVDRAQERQA
jgi:hypothetical protein